MPKLTLLATAALAALALGACDSRKINLSGDDGPTRALRAVTTLECPDHQGSLTRVRTAPDGLSCDYAGPKGTEVTLRLVKAEGGATQPILTALERELNALMPGVGEKLAKARAEAEADQAREAASEAAEASAEAAAEARAERAELEAQRYQALADKARAEASNDAADARAAQARADALSAQIKERDSRANRASSSDGERVNVRLPGMRVKAEGDSADVRLPGISVKAEGDRADVRVGPITIKADDSSGTSNVDIDADDTQVAIRSHNDTSEVRSRRKGPGVRASYILADAAASPAGWRAVGYEARGPEGGPLVVAVVKSKEKHGEDDIFDDAKALVRRNAGG